MRQTGPVASSAEPQLLLRPEEGGTQDLSSAPRQVSKLLAGVGVTLTPGPSAWLKGVLFSAAQGRGTFASPTQVWQGMGCAVQKHSLSAHDSLSFFCTFAP